MWLARTCFVNQVCFGVLLFVSFKLATSQYYCCPDGWIVYRDSCYKVSSDSKSWEESRDKCDELDATLLVLDSEHETDGVLREYGVRNLLSWIGLSFLSQSWDESVIWEGGGQLAISQLPWMNKRDVNNGHHRGIDCVAYFGHPNHESGYVNWYKCNLQLYYICERNSTLARWENNRKR